ncbi:hypothetical protein MTR67_026502 [Solanum verrucosum]|uniref:Reverse transcriptase n=1 Tax=Solanum verrucosum TaxID=315347 RepID=A0AAF0QZ22_SOLVR|nr:hypothetical protein MTR67_026502 [Solanum verrucosum]
MYMLQLRLNKLWPQRPSLVCTLSIFSHIVYALIDSGSTLSYVTPLIVEKFKRTPELLVKPFEVSTPIGESIIARRVYHNCIVTICDRDTLADLVELEMVDFDVIMGMDWLSSYYAMVDCRTKTVHFHFPKEAVLEWKGSIGAPREQRNSTHEKEMVDVVHCLQVWGVYLLGTRSLEHKLGKHNQVADALSRKEMGQVKDGTKRRYWIEDDLLHFKGGRIVVPNGGVLRKDLMKEAHDTTRAGHPGVEWMLDLLSRVYSGQRWKMI